MLKTIRKLRFSPEIEVEFDSNVVDTNDVLDCCDPCEDCDAGDCENCEKEDTDHSEHYQMGWDISEDGSLDNGLEYKPSGSNHLYYNKKSLLEIKKLLELIKNNGGYIDGNCGLHIHVDVESFTDEQVASVVRTFVVNQSKIISKFRVMAHRLSEWCKPLPDGLRNITAKDIGDFRRKYKDDFWKGEKKYHALNIDCVYRGSYHTLEFRLFNGTLCYETMKKYIYWVLDFVDKAKDGLYENM